MFGFVFGTFCLFMLARLVFRPRWAGGWHGRMHAWHHHGGDRGDCQERGFDDDGGFRPGRHGLYGLFRRLDLTPGQEKVVFTAVDELKGKASEARREAAGDRAFVASLLRQEHVSDEDVNRLQSRLDERLAALRASAGAQLQKIHEALDDRQRRLLADLVEKAGGLRGMWV